MTRTEAFAAAMAEYYGPDTPEPNLWRDGKSARTFERLKNKAIEKVIQQRVWMRLNPDEPIDILIIYPYVRFKRGPKKNGIRRVRVKRRKGFVRIATEIFRAIIRSEMWERVSCYVCELPF